MLVLLLGAGGARPSAGQELLDQVVAQVGSTPILLSDVTAALGLGLVELRPGDDPRAAATEQLIDRALALAEVDRFAPSEPDPAAVQQEAARLRARAGAELASLARSSGLDDDRIRLIARDSLRLSAYLAQRFGATAQVSDEEVRQYFLANEAEFTRDGVRLSFEDAEPLARQRAAAVRRAATVRRWLDDLRARGTVTRPRVRSAGSPGN